MGRAARLLIAGIAGIALLAGGLALAGPGREARRSDGSVMLTRIARRLELTDDQQTQIREILAKHWSAGLGDAAERARMARRQLRDVIGDPSADESTVRDAARKAAGASEDLAVQRHQAYAEAFAVLTPQQQDKAKALREQRRQRADRAFRGIDRSLRGD